MNSVELQNSNGFLMITMKSKELQWILKNLYKLIRIPQDYNEFYRFNMNPNELHRIPKDSYGLQ